jgi:hypothetical protein
MFHPPVQPSVAGKGPKHSTHILQGSDNERCRGVAAEMLAKGRDHEEVIQIAP